MKALTATEAVRRIKAMPGMTATARDGEIRVSYRLQEIARRFPELETRAAWIEKAEAVAAYDSDPEAALGNAVALAQSKKETPCV